MRAPYDCARWLPQVLKSAMPRPYICKSIGRLTELRIVLRALVPEIAKGTPVTLKFTRQGHRSMTIRRPPTIVEQEFVQLSQLLFGDHEIKLTRVGSNL